MLDIYGEKRVDYFWILCSKLKEQVEVRYAGYDPSIPLFEFSCPKCHEKTILKMYGHWEGLSQKPE